MSEQKFGQLMDPREHIRRELEDAGIDNPNEWREAVREETDIDPALQAYSELLRYLGEDAVTPNKETVKNFNKTKDALERLELLRTMSLPNVLACAQYSFDEGAYRYLAGRLNFYQKFIQGLATKVVGEHKDYINNEGATPETVRRGLLRDILFAAMIGTPEMAIYKISGGACVEIKGYKSDIYEGSIGYAYPFLRGLYGRARKSVERRIGDKKFDEQKIEHTSVMLAAHWLNGAMGYNPDRGPGSPYLGSRDEAIAWGRLGPQVKRQFRGMRQKICDIDLHNIGRFIGKSGDEKYDPERRRLSEDIGFLKVLGEKDEQEKKREFTAKENQFAVQKQQRWLERETEKLNLKFEKSKAEIEKLDLPEEEKGLQLQSVIARHQDAMAKLQADYEAQTARLRERTPEQLLADLEQRQILVNARHEKRKSLAQKALDLHFQFNHGGGKDYKPFKDSIDWINDAPFGLIKRCHAMARRGMPDESILAYALADAVYEKSGVTHTTFETLKKILQDNKNSGQPLTVHYLREVQRVADKCRYALSPEAMIRIASGLRHNFYGSDQSLESAFQYLGVDRINALSCYEVDVRSVQGVENSAAQFQYQFSSPKHIAAASLYLSSFARALEVLTPESVTTLLDNNINLDVYFDIREKALEENQIEKDYDDSCTRLIQRVNQEGGSLHELFDAIRSFGLALTEEIMREGAGLRTALVAFGEIASHVSEDALPVFKVIRMNDRISGAAFQDRLGVYDLPKSLWFSEKFNPPLDAELHAVFITHGEKKILRVWEDVSNWYSDSARAVTIAIVLQDREYGTSLLERKQLKERIWLSEQFNPPLDPGLHEARGKQNFLEIVNTVMSFGNNIPENIKRDIVIAIASQDREASKAFAQQYSFSLEGLIWLDGKFDPPLDPNLHAAIEAHGAEEVLKTRNDFLQYGKDVPHHALRDIVIALLSQDREASKKFAQQYDISLKGLIWLDGKFDPPLDDDLHESISIFGEDMLTLDQYRALQKLSQGEVVSEIATLGITKVGKEGMAQMREKISEFRKHLLSGHIDTRLIRWNLIAKGIFKTLVRFDTSSWRRNRTQTFNDVITSYEKNRTETEPLPGYMSPSDIQRIDTVERKQVFQFTEAFLTRYRYLNDQLREAFRLQQKEHTPLPDPAEDAMAHRETRKPFSHLVLKAQPVIEKIIQDLEQKKLAITKPEAQKGIQMRIDALRGLDLRSVRHFQETIRVLSQFDELKDLLLQAVFVASLRKNTQYHERVKEQIENSEPSVESVSFMLDFIDHVTNKETMKQYFPDKQSYRAFQGVVNVKAIEEELVRMQNQKIIGTVPVQFVPVRNLLTEFSGDIADACWTGKYESMLHDYPNFSSVIFVQDPNGKNERYVGAALLIETQSDAGEKLLVIRGLNPLETTINRLAVADFFTKFTTWVKETAAKDGRKAAIVIDGKSGGSGTNRPVLFQHMTSFKEKAPRVTLASKEDTKFNGYDIVNQCTALH